MSSAPVLARVEAKEAVLRWYPGEHGAHKYVLLQKFVEGLDNVDRLRATAGATSTSSSEEDWAVAYEGQVRARQTRRRGRQATRLCVCSARLVDQPPTHQAAA